MAKSDYFRDRHLIAVTDAARRAGIKGAALAVLSYLCAASAYKSPTVRRCKETICIDTGYGITAVKAALSRLRASGLIEPVACFEGGRNRATIYKLKANQQKGDENHTSNDDGDEKGYGKRQKGVWKTAQRGMDSIPPSISSSISSSRRDERSAAGRAAAGPHGPLARDGNVRPSLRPVAPGEVRGLLTEWGYAGSEIDGFGHRDVIALLQAEGYRLAG